MGSSVAAIDFGTTYSGYVFSLKKDPTHFYSQQTWNAGHGKQVSLKTPTSLLLNPDKTFNSFGFEAEDTYAELAEKGKHVEYYLFQKFKMDLHFKKLKKDSDIQDVSGRSVSALKVFSLSIKYLKDHCFTIMKDRGVQQNNVEFVLTVPAIWTDHSKQFMRVAAIEAGIADNKLTLALEPEAASIYCMRVPLETTTFGKSDDFTKQGKRYLVADIGGGTADFSVHEVAGNGSLTELYRASGGPHGGIYVNQEYLKIYDIIFGQGTIDQLKKEEMVEYLTLTRDFETKKRTVSQNRDSDFYNRISPFLKNRYSDNAKKRLAENISLKDEVTVSLEKFKLILSSKLMKTFFRNTLDSIVEHIKKIMKSIQNLDTILLVGGYSESPLLQEKIKSEFKDKQIIIPQDCSLAVLKGAVLFGFNPQSISERILRFSYGKAIHPEFDPKKHPEKNRYIDKEGTERCKDAFSQVIAKDTKVPTTGKTVICFGIPIYKDQRSYDLRFYCTEKDNQCVIDQSFQQLGTLKIPAPDHIKEMWEAEEMYVFGLTEIKISGKVKGTDSSVETIVDLLE